LRRIPDKEFNRHTRRMPGKLAALKTEVFFKAHFYSGFSEN
jgi:hypothetical protein